MTNLEALKANVSQVHGIVISANAFSKALVDQEITEDDIYTKANEEAIDFATIRIYKLVLGSPGLSEGDINYSPADIAAIKTVIDNLLMKWGWQPEFGSGPAARMVSPW